jgi:hypothetical protein
MTALAARHVRSENKSYAAAGSRSRRAQHFDNLLGKGRDVIWLTAGDGSKPSVARIAILLRRLVCSSVSPELSSGTPVKMRQSKDEEDSRRPITHDLRRHCRMDDPEAARNSLSGSGNAP